MNPMSIPKMMVSHGEGWSWMMRIHPSVAKIFSFYVLPLSIVPPAMLFYAWSAYRNTSLTEVSMTQAWVIAAVMFVAEIVAVPLMAAVIQRIGRVAEATAAYDEAFALAAVAPTPLWLAPLFLFVPGLIAVTLAIAAAMLASGMLIYQGVYAVFHLDDEGHSRLLAASVIAAGLVAWAAMML